MRYSRSKYILMLLGVAMLVFDVRIPSIFYPQFVEFRTEAPLTVSMVINHVIGNRMMIDIASDLVGFVAIVIASLRFLKDLKEGEQTTKAVDITQARLISRQKSGYMKTVFWSITGAVFYLAEKLMPFFLNGRSRFSGEYFLFYAVLALKTAVLVLVIRTVCLSLENLKTHMYVNTTAILMLIGAGCLVISRMSFFYEVMFGYYIYYVLCVGLIAFGAIRILDTIAGEE